MMKLLITSDVHFEHRLDGGHEFLSELFTHKDSVDVLVMAEDMTDHNNLSYVLGQLSQAFKQVVYVNGNHEAYGTTIHHVRQIVERVVLQHKNLTFLDNKRVMIDGQGFIGGTLWFPNQPENVLYTEGLNDFNMIGAFDVYSADRECDATKDALITFCRPGDIVVTHHLPHPLSISPQWRGQAGKALNRFFLCDMDKFMQTAQAKLWIHGHTHDSCDYEVYGTRVICNPLGYPHEVNPGYKNPLIVEV